MCLSDNELMSIQATHLKAFYYLYHSKSYLHHVFYDEVLNHYNVVKVYLRHIKHFATTYSFNMTFV